MFSLSKEKEEPIRFGSGAERLVYEAIKTKDLLRLRSLIERGFDPAHVYLTKPPKTKSQGLLELSVDARFYAGFEFLLQQQRVLYRSSIRMAFDTGDVTFRQIIMNRAAEHHSASWVLRFLELKNVKALSDLVKIPNFLIDDQSVSLSTKQLQSVDLRSRQSSLHVAVAFGASDLLNLLLESGARVDIEDAEGYTPLSLACHLRSISCCSLLVKHGANPSGSDPQRTYSDGISRSPLFAICNATASPVNDEIVEWLLRGGIDFKDERWLNPTSQLPGISQPGGNYIRSVSRNPSDLESLTFIVIRGQLSALAGGRSIRKTLDELPISKVLRYLRFY